MLNSTDLVSNQPPRILILSQRQLNKHIASSCLYEFEDVIHEVDAVDMFLPTESYKVSREVFKWVKRATKSRDLANFIRPKPNSIALQQEYDLLFVIAANLSELFAIDSIQNWRKKCKKAVCYLVELWERDVWRSQAILRFLSDFDHIFLGVNHVIPLVAEITERPCTYLPPGVDAIKFCPYPTFPKRSIDISYIGRRSFVTHQALLHLAKQGTLHYFYDTAANAFVYDFQEHRSLLANLIKRSRYFVTNRANANEPEKTRGQEEFGYRFMEGAAGGAVLIGDPPKTDLFQSHFDWPDAVIPIPFDAADIGTILSELDAQPERLSQIRKNNVIHTLQRHDWLYRWKTVLHVAHLDSTPAMLSRENSLQHLAQKYVEHDAAAEIPTSPPLATN